MNRTPGTRTHGSGIRTAGGAALILVLTTMSLLAATLLAFLAHTLSARQIASHSAQQTAVDLLAQGAAATLLGDFREEMAAGSRPPAPLNPLFIPSSPFTAVPFRVGSHDALPNLIKRSAAQTRFYDGPNYDLERHPPSSRAISQPSDGGAEGRVSRERWNRSLLLPKHPDFLEDDLRVLPCPEFVAPDWIPVARNPDTRSREDVVGRYAYLVFDEGGLLDANAAGHPLSVPSQRPGAGQMTAAQAIEFSRKGSLAFADLTRLGLSRTESDQLVGWRNYASAQPLGELPRLRFDTDVARASVSRYQRAVLAHTGGHLTGLNPSLYLGQSDRAFTSRQALMSFLLNGLRPNVARRAALQNALQYLGTFSRGLNQPSLAPDPDRPRIEGPASAGPNLNAYRGNNTAYQLDDQINPVFLNVRRWPSPEAGSVPGEDTPVANRRFPLSRLSLLTVDAVSAPESAIHRFFGLTRARPEDPWLYDHGIAHRQIGRLEDVAALIDPPRAPDFVELLKATIGVGSLGKAAATDGLAGLFQYRRDISVDLQVMQIAANLIDQADPDGFPTRIVLPDGTEVRGVENLPYFYRFRVGPLHVRLPVPPGQAPWLPAANSPALQDEGLGLFLLQPEIWNPHDQNAALGSPRPTEFRVLMETGEPGLTPTGGTSTAAVQFRSNNSQALLAFGTPVPFTADSTELLFSIPSARFYREPTLLCRAGVPSGSGLRPGPAHELRQIAGALPEGALRDAAQPAESLGYVGACLGGFPLRQVLPDQTVATAQKVSANFSASAVIVRLQCRSAAGQWITYDEKLLRVPALEATLPGGRPGLPPAPPGLLLGESQSWGQCADPRTARFGFAIGRQAPADVLHAAACALPSHRPDSGAGLAMHESGTPGAGLNPRLHNGLIGWGPPSLIFGNGAAPWRPGLLSQNRVDGLDDGSFLGRPDTPPHGSPLFYRDPDLVVRRGVAAFVVPGKTAAGGALSAVTSTGLPTATATRYPDLTPGPQSQSRPILLNRPFRSVGELGAVFRDQPWKDLDFSTPETADAGLLDVLSLREDTSPGGLVAGRVNLNTRQVPVLKAVLAGACRDEIATLPAADWARNTQPPLSDQEAEELARSLVAYTSRDIPPKGPLRNLSELVGRYVKGFQPPPGSASHQADTPFDGWSADCPSLDVPGKAPQIVPRFRQTALRALADSGNTRVWNLLIDLVAQTGRYPPGSKDWGAFHPTAEKRLWIHMAIDRWTGQVLDQDWEEVCE